MRAFRLGGAIVLGLAACVGQIGDGGEAPPDGFRAPDGVVPAGSVDPGPAPLRRLTRAQYDNTVADLLGTALGPGADTFPPEDEVNGYQNQAEAQTASHLLVEDYANAAEALAEEAVSTPERRAALVSCTPTGPSDGACLAELVREFGLRAFRRPVTDAELADLHARGLEEAGITGDFWEGARLVVEAMLQMPSFLYRLEQGSPNDERPELLQLDGYSVASRLSYLLIQSMPDDALLAAAAAGELHTRAEVEAQARRLLALPAAETAWRDYFEQWLGYAGAATESKDPVLHPDFDEALAASMVEETRRLVGAVAWGEADFLSLLTTDQTFVDAALASLYGVEAPAESGFGPTTLPAGRVGLLGQASVLSTYARYGGSSPTRRGLFVRTKLLCETIQSPPPDVDFSAVEPVEGDGPMTTRERYAQHAQEPCLSCHRYMDPIGFGLEHFDGIGKWRDDEEGRPIDATGAVERQDAPAQPFDGLPALAKLLYASPDVEACVIEQLGIWARGRALEDADDETRRRLLEAFRGADRRFRDLVVALAASDANRFIRP
jgi:hypothetical protein